MNNKYEVNPTSIIGPLYTETKYKDIKDPCILKCGSEWHIYGSGGSVSEERWNILHATAPTPEGPWTEQPTVILQGLNGDHVAAPSVIYDEEEGIFHMFVQTEFFFMAGVIEHLTSTNGEIFIKQDTAIHSIPDSHEAGIYDSHTAIIGGKKYLVYAGTPKVEGRIQPDIYLVESESGTWNGPWKRLGKILDHDHIAWHHNNREHPDYEWGIEGPQLLELPDGRILLNATCFLHEGRFGTRQRVFFAIANDLMGPYESVGPVLNNITEEWQSGENGHATVVVYEDMVYLFYQARSSINPNVNLNNWRFGLAKFTIKDINK